MDRLQGERAQSANGKPEDFEMKAVENSASAPDIGVGELLTTAQERKVVLKLDLM